jgi:hypothetical protein
VFTSRLVGGRVVWFIYQCEQQQLFYTTLGEPLVWAVLYLRSVFKNLNSIAPVVLCCCLLGVQRSDSYSYNNVENNHCFIKPLFSLVWAVFLHPTSVLKNLTTSASFLLSCCLVGVQHSDSYTNVENSNCFIKLGEPLLWSLRDHWWALSNTLMYLLVISFLEFLFSVALNLLASQEELKSMKLVSKLSNVLYIVQCLSFSDDPVCVRHYTVADTSKCVLPLAD